jgi:hypothetical protein
MALKPLLRPVCGRCGKPREGIRHVCRSNSSRKATVTLKLSFGKCGKCGKDVTNPLTHACKPKSDFKKRKAAAGRAKDRKKRQADKHDYQACSDQDCPRPLCAAYKAGWKAGYQEGYAQGYTVGYAAGFVDGIAACPRAHA